MPYEGYSRRNNAYRDLQPVSIISVDPISRTAVAVTRTRHKITINTAYATGETITTPAAGEQWYCERFDNEWRLYGRIPFNDATLNIKPEEGQVLVGSATGPLELNGDEVRVNSKVFRLNGVYYRDDGTALQRSTDQVNWTAITASDMTNLVPVIANALANYEGDDPAEAITALQDWGGLVQTVLDNFAAFWNEICQNVFVSGLKRMGFGDTDLSKIVNGMQNFIDYLFGVIFCDFDGNLTPQTALARLRDLLAPITSNPFVLGLQQIADILGVAIGNLLNDAVTGATSLVELIFNIITCNWDALAEQLQAIFEIIDLADGDNPFGPANIIKSLYNLFQFLGSPEINGVPNPVGIFVTALGSIIAAISEASGNLLQDAVSGAVEFIRLIFRVLSCDPTVLQDLQNIIGDAVAGFDDPVGILAFLKQIVDGIIDNPLIAAIQAFATDVLGMTGSLLENIINATGDLMNLILKVIKDILPFDEVWTQLFPFIDWDAVDAVVLPSLATLLNGNPLWTIIFKPIDDLLGGLFTTFITNLNSLFSGMGLLNGNFDPEEAIEYLLNNILGLATWFQTTILDGAASLFAWIQANIFGNVSPTAFFDNLQDLFGIDLRTGTFNPIEAATNFLETFFDPTSIPTLDEFGKLGVDIIGDIFEFTTNNVIRPIVTTLLVGTGLDLTKFGINNPEDLLNVDLSVLGDLAGTLLTSLGEIPAEILRGLLPPAVLSVVPVSNISETSPNLLTQGAFNDSISIESADGWSWDTTQNAPGGSTTGSAKVTVSTAKNRYLYSRQAIPVAKGDRLVFNAAIKTSGLTVSPAGSLPVSIALIPFIGSTAQDPVVIGSAGTTPDWTTIGQAENTSYEVTNASWTTVIVRLGVSSAAQPMSFVWFDDISLKKTGLLIQYNVDSLVPTWQQMWDGAFGSGGETKTWADMFDLQYTVNTAATTGVTNAGIADGKAQDTIDGINQGITGATGGGALPSTVGLNIGGLSDFTTGFTQSGSNLLPDPKISSTRLWNQSGLAVSTDFSNSTSQSLRFTGNGSARSFYFPTNGFGLPYAIGTWPDRVYYVECYVYLPAANPNTTATVSLFTQGTILPFATGTAISPMTFTAAGTWSAVTLTNPVRGAWNRLYGYFKVPTLRNGFTAGITFTAANTHQVYVDDLVITDVTEVVTTNDKLYGRPTPADTVAQTKITGSLAGSTSLATDISTTYAAASGAAGTASQAFAAASGAQGTAEQAFAAASGAVGAASTAQTSTTNLKNSIIAGYTVIPVYSSGWWNKPDGLSELYVACFGGGAKGATAASNSDQNLNGGRGGISGGFVAGQVNVADVPASVYCTIGGNTSTSPSPTSFGSLVSSESNFRGYVATPLGLMSTGSQPGNGGNGGNYLQSGATAGQTTVVGVAGGAAGPQGFGNYPGGGGSNGLNFGLSQTGGGGGGGGGFVSAGFGSMPPNPGGPGGFPGGGGGGGGYNGSGGGGGQGVGGNGGLGFMVIIYKIAKTTA